jgi:predicted GH43/DUF377 family glycosyl hydrolase
MSHWMKLGRVYAPDGSLWWAKTHAMVPTPIQISDEIVRVFISCCDENGVGRVGYVDVSATDPTQVKRVAPEPVLDIGQPGCFDENGALACSVVSLTDGRMYMYYVGFELGRKIRYRLLTGMAVAEPGKDVFQRVKQVPVLERSDQELFFRGGPFAIYKEGLFRMWYVAGSGWENIDGIMKPVYDIRYLESENGIQWPDQGELCIQIEKDNEHGFGRPYVTHNEGLYKIFYSVRRRDLNSYRLGYAESKNGIHWYRKDESLNLDVSAEGWDSEMICYSAVIQLRGKWYMFYNGNNFGETGFGLAMLES